MKILKVFVIYFTILSIGALGFYQPAFSQGITKEVNPQFDVEPGSTVEVTLRIPGGTAAARSPADTMLVMDRTGSMGDWWGPGSQQEQKIVSAKKALKAFVDQTKEDGGLKDPGDYVGLVTYSTPSTTTCLTAGVFDQFKCSTLDFPIANMTNGQPPFVPPLPEPDNKTAIKTAMDSFQPGYNTPIGAGMNLANKELLNQVDKPGGPPSSSRDGVAKFMVLATDGIQNTFPAPSDLGILQTSIDNKIMVFTVGIGNDVNQAFLKNIACKTDTAALDPVNYCRVGSPIGNTPANPRNFFVANDPKALTTIYETIAKLIAGNFSYLIFEWVNTQLFWGPTGAPRAENCATGAPWPIENQLASWPYSLFLIRSVPEGTDVCLKFDLLVRSDPWFYEDLDAAGGEIVGAVDDPYMSQTSLWDFEGSCDNNPADGYIDFSEAMICWAAMREQTPVEFNNTTIHIINPARPWLKTTGGDVGSLGKIEMVRDPAANPAIPSANADYLVISGELGSIIRNFKSAKYWLVHTYGGLGIPPFPAGSMYQAMLDMYSKKECTATLTGSNPTQIKTAITTSGCRVLRYSGAFTVSGNWTYDGPAAIIFIDNKMSLEPNSKLEIAPSTGLIFVVKGETVGNDGIIIDKTVTRADGIFITDKAFNTVGPNCSSGSNNQPLTINGAVYAFGQACFTRSLSSAQNKGNPAELINFEPKYLWLFKDIAGSAPTIYRELVP